MVIPTPSDDEDSVTGKSNSATNSPITLTSHSQNQNRKLILRGTSSPKPNGNTPAVRIPQANDRNSLRKATMIHSLNLMMVTLAVCTLEFTCSPPGLTDRLYLLHYVAMPDLPSVRLCCPHFNGVTCDQVILPGLTRLPNPKQPAGIGQFSDGSETESDDEPPVPVISVPGSNPSSQAEPLETRPSFRLGPAQRNLNPLVLDQRKHIQVPSAINTFLREYQRGGVRFLYDKFRKSMGGMLGDDMGLVGFIWNSVQMDRVSSDAPINLFLDARAKQFKSYHFYRPL